MPRARRAEAARRERAARRRGARRPDASPLVCEMYTAVVGPVARCSACGRPRAVLINHATTRLHTGTVTGRLHRVQYSERIDYRLGRLDLAYRESPRRSYT